MTRLQDAIDAAKAELDAMPAATRRALENRIARRVARVSRAVRRDGTRPTSKAESEDGASLPPVVWGPGGVYLRAWPGRQSE